MLEWDRDADGWRSLAADGVIADACFVRTSGNGITEAGGVLTMDRDGPTDSIRFVPPIGGEVHFSFSIRNTQMHWKDMFHGFQLLGPCDPARNIDGISFGFSKYGNFFLAKSSCGGRSYSYPAAYALNTWYSFDVTAGGGNVTVRVNGNVMATGEVPNNELVLTLPGMYEDGGAETNTISQVDNFALQVFKYTHTVDVQDGVVSSGMDFGTDQ